MSGNDPAEHTITVSGVGLVSAEPDVADIMIGVSVTKPAVKDARAGAAVAMTAVIAAAKQAGVADRDIRTANLSLNPVQRYDGNAPKLIGYEFANTVRITVRDLSKVPDVVDQAAAVGATTINGISFRIDDPTKVEAKARELAMADARARADALARLAGVAIRGVAAISEDLGGGPMPPRPDARLRPGQGGERRHSRRGGRDRSLHPRHGRLPDRLNARRGPGTGRGSRRLSDRRRRPRREGGRTAATVGRRNEGQHQRQARRRRRGRHRVAPRPHVVADHGPGDRRDRGRRPAGGHHPGADRRRQPHAGRRFHPPIRSTSSPSPAPAW